MVYTVECFCWKSSYQWRELGWEISSERFAKFHLDVSPLVLLGKWMMVSKWVIHIFPWIMSMTTSNQKISLKVKIS